MASPEQVEELGTVAALRSAFVEPQPTEQDYYTTYFLSNDAKVLELLLADEDKIRKLPGYAGLIPSLSHLNRTGKLSPRLRRINRLRFESQILFIEFDRDEDDKDADWFAMDQGMMIFGNVAMEDSDQGYRGKLLTENRRVTKLEGLQGGKVGVLDRIMGRGGVRTE